MNNNKIKKALAGVSAAGLIGSLGLLSACCTKGTCERAWDGHGSCGSKAKTLQEGAKSSCAKGSCGHGSTNPAGGAAPSGTEPSGAEPATK